MSIDNFIPEVWSPAILVNLRKALKFGALLNTDYEGDIANYGDTVNITSFGFPAVRDYAKNQDISWDLLSDATRALVIDQADYFAFTVDDIDRRQAMKGFVEQATSDAGYGLAEETDEYVAGILTAGVDSTNKLGNIAVSVSSQDLYPVFVKLRTRLAESKIPAAGRWVVVPPKVTEYLLQDPRFINAQASADAGMALHEGALGRIAGFDVIESLNTVETSEDEGVVVLAGHSMAATYADQITETEAIRLQNQFGDGIRGLHLFGAKVVRPTALASAVLDLD